MAREFAEKGVVGYCFSIGGVNFESIQESI